LDVEVGKRGEYMATGHVFIIPPMSTIQSAVFDFNLRGYLLRMAEHPGGWGKYNRVNFLWIK
jgi:hypothetical protein